MSSIIVKPSEDRVDDLRRTQKWREAQKHGSNDLSHMNFKSEGEERDYRRAVSASKYNVLGLPNFFPPDLLWGTGVGEGQPCETLACGHPWRTKTFTDREIIYRCKYNHEHVTPKEQPL